MEVEPDTPPVVTVIVTLPGEWAVTAPLSGSTDATAESDDSQCREAGSLIGTCRGVASLPVRDVPVAVSCSVAPTGSADPAGGTETATDVSSGCTANCTVPSGWTSKSP